MMRRRMIQSHTQKSNSQGAGRFTAGAPRLTRHHIVLESSLGNINVRPRSRHPNGWPHHGCPSRTPRDAPSMQQGGGEQLLATPAPKLYPGGGDGYREAELVFSGDGSCDPSPGTPASGGDKCRRIAPSRQALPSGRATNFVPPLDFTLNRIVCFPSFCASETVLRNSAGVVTGLPPMSRMMSPTSRP